jgi:hypothetical protein
MISAMRPPSPARLALFILLAILAVIGLAGCADDGLVQDSNQTPWTPTAKWEGSMPMMDQQASRY